MSLVSYQNDHFALFVLYEHMIMKNVMQIKSLKNFFLKFSRTLMRATSHKCVYFLMYFRKNPLKSAFRPPASPLLETLPLNLLTY